MITSLSVCGGLWHSVGGSWGAQPLRSTCCGLAFHLLVLCLRLGGFQEGPSSLGEQLHQFQLEIHSLLAFQHVRAELRGTFLQKSVPRSGFPCLSCHLSKPL